MEQDKVMSWDFTTNYRTEHPERMAQMLEMRKEGKSLQSIGITFGFSREFVRQCLQKAYGTTKLSNFLNESEVARLLGCSPQQLQLLRKRGLIHPVKREGQFCLYSSEILSSVLPTIDCQGCGKPLENNRRKWCLECKKGTDRPAFRFLTPEQRARRIAANKKWALANPEKKGAINRRANAKHRQKLREERKSNVGA